MGLALKKMHTYDYIENSDWEERFTKKINQKIETYKTCGYQSFMIDEMIVAGKLVQAEVSRMSDDKTFCINGVKDVKDLYAEYATR